LIVAGVLSVAIWTVFKLHDQDIYASQFLLLKAHNQGVMQYTSKQGRIQNRVCIKYTNRIRESQNLIRFFRINHANIDPGREQGLN
jgi:hypothetical protein